MKGFCGDGIGRLDNPMVSMSRGDFFIPVVNESESERRLILSMLTDAVVLGGFFLMVILLSLR